MTHSMSDVSFRKRVSNVEEKGGKISLTRKKHSEDVGEGLALSSVCCFSTLTCSRWLLVTGSDWLIPKLAFFCVLQSTTLALAYLHLVLLTDFRIAPTGRRQSKEGPDTGWEGCGGGWSLPPTERALNILGFPPLFGACWIHRSAANRSAEVKTNIPLNEQEPIRIWMFIFVIYTGVWGCLSGF